MQFPLVLGKRLIFCWQLLIWFYRFG